MLEENDHQSQDDLFSGNHNVSTNLIFVKIYQCFKVTILILLFPDELRGFQLILHESTYCTFFALMM